MNDQSPVKDRFAKQRQEMVRQSTLIGTTAILMWSTLGVFAKMAGPVPPFLLLALCFSTSGFVFASSWFIRGKRPSTFLGQSLPVWALGILGLTGYHLFYFLGIQNAPAVEANLINYGWPLLIVLFSGLLPGEHLRWYHLAGGFIGLAGTVLVVAGLDFSFSVDPADRTGYGWMALAALAWSSYSVLSRLFGHVPTDVVGGFCLASAALCWGVHFITEPTIWPDGLLAWVGVIGMGLGPVGLSFYSWDVGMKYGDIRALGVMAYAAPVMSTILLFVAGYGSFTLVVPIALAMIVAGGLLGSMDLFKKRY